MQPMKVRLVMLLLTQMIFFEGLLNIYVMYNFDTETWFNVKFYGMTAMTMVFMLGLGFYLAKYVKDEKSPAPVKQEEQP